MWRRFAINVWGAIKRTNIECVRPVNSNDSVSINHSCLVLYEHVHFWHWLGHPLIRVISQCRGGCSCKPCAVECSVENRTRIILIQFFHHLVKTYTPLYINVSEVNKRYKIMQKRTAAELTLALASSNNLTTSNLPCSAAVKRGVFWRLELG